MKWNFFLMNFYKIKEVNLIIYNNNINNKSFYFFYFLGTGKRELAP